MMLSANCLDLKIFAKITVYAQISSPTLQLSDTSNLSPLQNLRSKLTKISFVQWQFVLLDPRGQASAQ